MMKNKTKPSYKFVPYGLRGDLEIPVKKISAAIEGDVIGFALMALGMVVVDACRSYSDKSSGKHAMNTFINDIMEQYTHEYGTK